MKEYKFEKLGNGCELCVSDEHTFGTDAFLLADFAKARHKDLCCDLGTGCGIIAVLLRLRYTPKEVWGVDIQEEAVEQLRLTVKNSRFDNVHPVCMDMKNIPGELPCGMFDLVTCNPPYKAAGAGMESLCEAHRIARHEIMCNINDICKAADKLLKFGGRLCLCSRPERLADVICAMRENHIEPKRLRFVTKSPESPPWLFLVEGRKGGKPFMTSMPTLFMSGGGISPELMEIYGDSCRDRDINE
ncbi:MAG: methyltransferase [Ruminococcus sp.]|nr:methyltransferase [Ruminococcus sp.]